MVEKGSMGCEDQLQLTRTHPWSIMASLPWGMEHFHKGNLGCCCEDKEEEMDTGSKITGALYNVQKLERQHHPPLHLSSDNFYS